MFTFYFIFTQVHKGKERYSYENKVMKLKRKFSKGMWKRSNFNVKGNEIVKAQGGH
jgi:hypothetical protein